MARQICLSPTTQSDAAIPLDALVRWDLRLQRDSDLRITNSLGFVLNKSCLCKCFASSNNIYARAGQPLYQRWIENRLFGWSPRLSGWSAWGTQILLREWGSGRAHGQHANDWKSQSLTTLFINATVQAATITSRLLPIGIATDSCARPKHILCGNLGLDRTLNQ